MAQNSQRLAWTTQEVDAKLKNIMAEAYGVSFFLVINTSNINLNVTRRFA
jgi:glutamate dehydrogenase/leucine dehydrogenase